MFADQRLEQSTCLPWQHTHRRIRSMGPGSLQGRAHTARVLVRKPSKNVENPARGFDNGASTLSAREGVSSSALAVQGETVCNDWKTYCIGKE